MAMREAVLAQWLPYFGRGLISVLLSIGVLSANSLEKPRLRKAQKLIVKI